MNVPENRGNALRRRSARLVAAALACALPALPAAGDDDVPHRKLSTDAFFRDRPELNSGIAPFFPHAEELARIGQAMEIIRKEAERQKLDPDTASRRFWRDVVARLGRDAPELLDALPDLAERLKGELGAESDAELGRLLKLAKAFEDSPFREALTRFGLGAALRAQADPEAGERFQEGLRRLRNLLERAGVPPPALERMAGLYRGLRGRGSEIADRLRSFSRGTLGELPTLELPGVLAPAVIAAFVGAAAASILLLRQKRTPGPAPPPLPDFERLDSEGGTFATALLAFYRRMTFEAGVPFRGRPVRELKAVLEERFPELAPEAARLNEAFYELWYGHRVKTPGELHALNAGLARLAARAFAEGEV